MKSALTLLTLVTTSILHAHPGAPGHTHPENTGTNEWPFPDFSWEMIIAASAITALALTFTKLRQKA